MATIVVVTTHALSATDASDLIELSPDKTSTTFHVAVPKQPTSASMSAVIDDWEMDVASGRGSGAANHPARQENPGAIADHDAQSVLDASLKALRDAGVTADGEVTPQHPLDSIGDIVAHHKPDEVVVMIRHHSLRGAAASDLAAKIKRKFDVDTLRVKAH